MSAGFPALFLRLHLRGESDRIIEISQVGGRLNFKKEGDRMISGIINWIMGLPTMLALIVGLVAIAVFIIVVIAMIMLAMMILLVFIKLIKGLKKD